MKEYFYQLSDHIIKEITGNEVLLINLEGESSDFARLNHTKIRQAGKVFQTYITLELISGSKSAKQTITLSANTDLDKAAATDALTKLRELSQHLPDDPYILYSQDCQSSEVCGDNNLPDNEQVLADISSYAAGKDLVGIYAAGKIMNGFANSLGQRNWFEKYNFNVDFSLYHQDDKAVKSSYAGFAWDSAAFQAKMERAGRDLEIVSRQPKTIKPGKYNVFLAPAALSEFMHMLNWGGFSMREHQTKNTCLLKMIEENSTLHPSVTIQENTQNGIGANFQDKGFIKPHQVTLIDKGHYHHCLTCPRSAQEYQAATNAAGHDESACSLEMAPGSLKQNQILQTMDTGIYINNAWYLNFSDHSSCRITGMTRFATFWVENGKIQAPLSVMRFDETIYNILGNNLIGLTEERDYLMDPDSYYQRSTMTHHLPGALVKEFSFTL